VNLHGHTQESVCSSQRRKRTASPSRNAGGRRAKGRRKRCSSPHHGTWLRHTTRATTLDVTHVAAQPPLLPASTKCNIASKNRSAQSSTDRRGCRRGRAPSGRAMVKSGHPREMITCSGTAHRDEGKATWGCLGRVTTKRLGIVVSGSRSVQLLPRDRAHAAAASLTELVQLAQRKETSAHATSTLWHVQ